MSKSKGSHAARKRAAKAQRDKLAARAAAAGLPGLAETPRRDQSGQAYRSPVERDPARAALEARCRQLGLAPTRANVRDVRAPWWGCKAGAAMATAVQDDAGRAELWDAICHMRRVQVAFDRAIGAPSRHATCLRLLLPVERMEADADAPPADDRPEADRYRAAVSALMAVEGWLGWTDGASAGQAKRAVLDDDAVTDCAGMLSALRCVADGLNGRAMVYRGRR